jgi:hypothetical protein
MRSSRPSAIDTRRMDPSTAAATARGRLSGSWIAEEVIPFPHELAPSRLDDAAEPAKFHRIVTLRFPETDGVQPEDRRPASGLDMDMARLVASRFSLEWIRNTYGPNRWMTGMRRLDRLPAGVRIIAIAASRALTRSSLDPAPRHGPSIACVANLRVASFASQDGGRTSRTRPTRLSSAAGGSFEPGVVAQSATSLQHRAVRIVHRRYPHPVLTNGLTSGCLRAHHPLGPACQDLTRPCACPARR